MRALLSLGEADRGTPGRAGAKPRREARVCKDWWAADARALRTAHWAKEAAARFVPFPHERRAAARSLSCWHHSAANLV